jgi:Tol biopolymer transport system component
VAVKILPAHLTQSFEFRQRFEREAKSISQLAHPNICTLHDVGQQDGISYLVMELLDGQSLADRLAKGPLPLDQVLRYGAEIASALHAAHRKGVIHRDLKPGNVVLTKTGAKLLDFGLAKSDALIDSDPSAVTVTHPLTSKGTIVGTFQYMSPEQLEGQEADARTDIFGLGAVLYEMATGKRAFEGHSRASLIASIMTAQPRPISELQPMTPPALDRLIRKCLAKDPDARWQSAADVADELRWMSQGGSQIGLPAIARTRKHRERVWIVSTVLLILVCAYLTFRLFGEGETKARRVWSTISAPEETTLVAAGDLAGPVAISPDGSNLTFAAVSDGTQRLWVRPLGARTASALAGTEGATFPFWSPDSRSIGYFAKEKLYTISAGGGAPMSLCDAIGGRGGAWNRDGVIVFSPAFRSGLFRISATGGKPEPVTKLDESQHTSHRWPAFCPDGKHLLYLAVAHGTTASDSNAVYLSSLNGGEPKLVMRGSANASLVSGYLLYPRENTLLAAPFDVGEARLRGDPVVVATEVMYDGTTWRAAFSASERGELAFHRGTAGGSIQMVRRDRSGKELGKIGEPDAFGGLSISPDGKKVATDISGATTDVWVYDVARGVRSRLTFEEGAHVSPVWSPDGQYLAYAQIFFARPEAMHRVLRQPATGGGEEVLHSSGEETWATDWSADGKYLLLCKGKYIGGKPSDIWVMPLEGERTPFPLLKTPFIETDGRFSPDGKWVAYSSDESGAQEIYIIPFDPRQSDGASAVVPRGGKWQVSARGGFKPKWRADGKELYFADTREGQLVAVEITVTPQGLEIGTPTHLFPVSQPAGIDPFDVSADGEWFVENASTAQASAPINLIVNWDVEIEKR